MKEAILKCISNEIERNLGVKVLSIDYWSLISLCVRVKIQFKDDFIYKPFEDIPTPDSICFSEKTITFIRRVDLFECVKKGVQLN